MIRTSKGLVEIDHLPDAQDEALTYTCCIESEGQAKRTRKDKPMNPQMQTEVQRELSSYSELALSETDLLAAWGFDPYPRVAQRDSTRQANNRRNEGIALKRQSEKV